MVNWESICINQTQITKMKNALNFRLVTEFGKDKFAQNWKLEGD
jgi:hypothetical protein